MSLLHDRRRQLHLIAWAEGISYLFLLLVAMPLKYLADQPEWVRISGMIHGVLFVLFTISALQAKIEYRWTAGRFIRVWLTCFVPFGMLLVDRVLAGGGIIPSRNHGS